MADITALNNLKQEIEKGKAEINRAEANLETGKTQREEVIAEIKELGVNPDKLDEAIAELDIEYEEKIKQAKALLGG